MNWNNTEDILPTKGQAVKWMDSGGNVHEGTYQGVWLLSDGVYIYYQPQFWQEA